MAINKIIGVMLEDNLLRDGSDLSVETDLFYIDVNNSRIGIETSTPESSLDILGTLKINDILISGNTLLNRNPDGFNFDLEAGDLNVQNSHIINLAYPTNDFDAATKSYVDDIIGSDVKDRITSNTSDLRIAGDGISTILSLTTDSNATLIFQVSTVSADFDVNIIANNNLTVNGLTSLGSVLVSGSNITTESASGLDLTISSDSGTVVLNGNVQHSTTSAGKIIYTDTNNNIISNPALTFDGNLLQLTGQARFDNVIIDGDTLSTISTLNVLAPDVIITGTNSVNINTPLDKNIVLSTSGNGMISVLATTSLTIPSGTTAQRPTILEQGAMRFNQNLNHPEIWNGFEWAQFGPTFAGLTNQTIVPDGISQNYNLDQQATSASILVSLNGVMQTPETAYGVSGTIISFSAIPLVTDIISIRFLSAITSVRSITDTFGNTLVEALTGEVNIDVLGINKITVVENFIEISTNFIPDANLNISIGAPARQFVAIHANNTSTDFVGDNIYSVGTVMKAGGLNEVTNTISYADPTVVGIISFNDATTNSTIATSGKAICQVEGSVSKGDLLTSSNTSGVATVLNPIDYVPGCVIGKSLQDFPGPAGNINIIVSIF